jgi:hypothetical protein
MHFSNKEHSNPRRRPVTGEICRSVAANVAALDRRNLPVKETADAAGRAPARPDAPERTSEVKQDIIVIEGASEPVPPRPAASSFDLVIFEHPYVKRLEAEVGEFKSKYENQVRRTENILEDANKRLVEMAQAGQIAGSKTLAEYLLAAVGDVAFDRLGGDDVSLAGRSLDFATLKVAARAIFLQSTWRAREARGGMAISCGIDRQRVRGFVEGRGWARLGVIHAFRITRRDARRVGYPLLKI